MNEENTQNNPRVLDADTETLIRALAVRGYRVTLEYLPTYYLNQFDRIVHQQ